MRWWMVAALPLCIGAGEAPKSTLPVEIGVLSCTFGGQVDTAGSDPSLAAGEAREILCSFTPRHGPEEAYVGVLKSISATGTLPEKGTMLWVVRAPWGTQLAPGLLQQSYAADSTTPAGQTPPLLGERNGEITLLTMEEKAEGSASKEKPETPRFLVTAIELKLKNSAT